ncbi:Golgi to ER traffic protein 4 homolog isoform X1 [Selaginella moellendorffii]|uniref:Golgi to ER traffic protein 4 homolog isoform X1 n=1 Tax=Selaginella moellendorffii TaxID=88036 RepID=UPI000D1C2770|nr:Golgi to ER traffic protein 4 homolog isoform X1 [Selaginella moellendorffii]|eukprot:XP_024542180.1 Golgi to ER traffic protein 4 homolog isoform X1 [Selaginella moellendorffii]
MARPGRESGGTLKTLEKLEKNVRDGKFYEAQQMYKTIFARYMASKKHTEALDLLQSGASIQLRHGQVTCGVELGLLLVEGMTTIKLAYGPEALDRIKAVFKEFPRSPTLEAQYSTKTLIEGVSTFMKVAIRWSSEFGAPSRGSPELHELLADFLARESPQPDLAKAFYHYVRGNNPSAFASAIISGMLEPEEGDLLLARGVFLYLSMGNLRDANKLFDELHSQLKDSSQASVLASPLTHLAKFILLTLERDALPLFRMLRENYKSSLDRDPSLNELLDVVAEKFYNVRQRRNGLFGDLMKMLTDGGA